MGYLKDTAFLKELGIHLREIRKQKGFTQEELAFKMGVEISQISRIERGISNTSISTVNAIAIALEIPLKLLVDINN